jgi:hypothetical protein
MEGALSASARWRRDTLLAAHREAWWRWWCSNLNQRQAPSIRRAVQETPWCLDVPWRHGFCRNEGRLVLATVNLIRKKGYGLDLRD